MKRMIDISRSLVPEIATWPGDVRFQLTYTFERKKGASVNVSRLDLSVHTGTHIDAPWHFLDDGLTVDLLELHPFWGPARVLTVERRTGPLYPDDLSGVDLRRVKRLLIHSAASDLASSVFPTEFVFPSVELAAFLGSQGIILYGSDAPSMDAYDDSSLKGHRALHENGIAILEGLNLSGVADGVYELCALPLRAVGADGSPVRAVLRPI